MFIRNSVGGYRMNVFFFFFILYFLIFIEVERKSKPIT